MFLTLMVIGLVGLVTMTIPAFNRHGSAHLGHGSAHVGHGSAPSGGLAKLGALRFVPSPRGVFSVLALYGAFGNACIEAAHLSFALAAGIAIVPTAIVERFAVMPLWRLLFQSAAEASAPLGELICEEATAVTSFRNGRGMISVVREGRLVQFAARLRADQSTLAVKVGERLRIDDIDAKKERFTVSLWPVE